MEHRQCLSHPEIVCRNRDCFLTEKGYCNHDPHERISITTEIKDMSDFHRGARAMFDEWISRAAGRYHGNPVVQRIIDQENELIYEWAEDALETISPQSYKQWKTAIEMYRHGIQTGKKHRDAELKEEKEERQRQTDLIAYNSFKWMYASICLLVTLGALVGIYKRSVPGIVGCLLAAVVTGVIAFTLHGASRGSTEDSQKPPRRSPPAMPPDTNKE